VYGGRFERLKVSHTSWGGEVRLAGHQCGVWQSLIPLSVAAYLGECIPQDTINQTTKPGNLLLTCGGRAAARQLLGFDGFY
jgi:hypothetical protein